MTKKEIYQLNKLKKSLNKIEWKLKNIAIEIATIKNTSNIYWSRLSKKVRRCYEEAKIIFARWTQNNLPYFYNKEIKEQIKRIKSMSFIPKKNGIPIKVNYIKFINTNLNTQYKTSIIKEAIVYFSTAIDEGNKSLNRVMLLTQQTLIKESIISKSIASGLKEKGTIRGVQEKLRDKLLKKAFNGGLLKIIDKNGNERFYNISNYANMVARTTIINSQSQATIAVATEYNTDLIQVSSHNTTTEICQQYEGKIFSLSGKDKDFPIADNVPAYHPNCKHSISIIFREVLERRGIQKYIDFSSGKTDIHPTRKNYIPINKRTK